MESKLKYTADILFNGESIDSHSSNNLDQLTAQVINHIESEYPNATGRICDKDGNIIQTYRKTSFD